MRKIVPLLLICVLALTVMLPQQGHADAKLNQLEQQIAQAKREQAAADRKAKEAESKFRAVEAQQRQTEQSLQDIHNRKDATEAEIERLRGEIAVEEANRAETERLIEEAEERIAARDELLRNRMHFMYTNGSVSYLAVLLNATSFSDFIDRFNSLQALVGQDKEILASNVKDHDIVVTKKGEIVEQLNHLADLHEQEEAAYESLMARQKEEEVMIASLVKDKEQLSEITEEQERIAMEKIALANKLQKEMDDYILVNFYKGGKLAYPLPKVYRVSSEFGRRTHPVTGKKGSMHNGIDFAAPNGTNILAAESGRVITAEFLSGYGNTVVIDHGSELWTLYAHIRPNGIKVKAGQMVKKGEKIAEVGTTGTSTGYHLHFEVRKDGKAVNPRDYLNLK